MIYWAGKKDNPLLDLDSRWSSWPLLPLPLHPWPSSPGVVLPPQSPTSRHQAPGPRETPRASPSGTAVSFSEGDRPSRCLVGDIHPDEGCASRCNSLQPRARESPVSRGSAACEAQGPNPTRSPTSSGLSLRNDEKGRIRIHWHLRTPTLLHSKTVRKCWLDVKCLLVSNTLYTISELWVGEVGNHAILEFWSLLNSSALCFGKHTLSYSFLDA